MSGSTAPLLTLEPFMDAVRDGVEASGWELSGLQKTTSHQFEGRWAGESTRSAYLFFHLPGSELPVSIDVYLDETSRGLTGNIALVVDLLPLGSVGGSEELLGELGRRARAALPAGYRSPVTLRFRLRDGGEPPSGASTEVRFKLTIPRSALQAGASAISALSSTAVGAFRELMDEPLLVGLMERD